MNANEPVAYGKYLEEHDYWITASGIIPNPKEGYVPLYTHPAKTLTDEEIEKTAEMMADMYNLAMLKLKGSHGYSEQCNVMEEILRAILRKAQEK